MAIKAILWLLSYFVDFQAAAWDDKLVGGLDFFANSVLQVPFFLMSLMRYITPTLDQMYATPMFVRSLRAHVPQVHGFSAMGGSDICSETQVGRPKDLTSYVLPKPTIVLNAWRYKQT